MSIDREQLRELASDPNMTSKQVKEALGVSDPTFYGALKADSSLKRIWEEGRAAAGVNGKPSTKKPAKKSAAPPRNGHAKNPFSDGLLDRIVAEFAHIKAWDEVSEHFDEVCAEIAALA